MLTRNSEQGLAHRERIERFVAGEIDLASSQSSLSIIRLRISQSIAQDKKSRSTNLNSSVEGMLNVVRRALRGGDVLFEFSELEYVVVLTQTDSVAATGVASRILELVGEARPELSASFSLVVGVASAPADGRSLGELVEAAQERRSIPPDQAPSRPPSVH